MFDSAASMGATSKLVLALAIVSCTLFPIGAFCPMVERLPSKRVSALVFMSSSTSSDIAPSAAARGISSRRDSLVRVATTASALVFLSPFRHPVSAAVKASSTEEAQKAAREIKVALRSMADMQDAASKAEWETVKDLLERLEFKNFENTATTLVRSDLLTAEDKTSLGTIRRFGLTADFIITLGGLESELRAGGVLPPLKGAIVEEDDEGGEKGVNRREALKFVKLARGALQEIDRITSSVLPEAEQ